MHSTPVGASSRRKAAAVRRSVREGTAPNSGGALIQGDGVDSDSGGGRGDYSDGGQDPMQVPPMSSTSSGSGTYHASTIPRKYKGPKPNPPSHFSSYLRFDRSALSCLTGFVLCYSLVLLCFLPMITFVPPDGSSSDLLPADADGHVRRGASFDRVRGRDAVIRTAGLVRKRVGSLEEKAHHLEERAKAEVKRARDEAEMKMAAAGIGRRDGFDALRASALLEDAVSDFEHERERGAKELEGDIKRMGDVHEGGAGAVAALQKVVRKGAAVPVGDGGRVTGKGAGGKETRGFVVLGMHRSGTSMLSGLLVKGFGYETGGPLIMPAFDNEKGFYERIDVVLQNDEFFNAQHMGWSYNVMGYDSDKALEDQTRGTITFREGKKALRFLNDPHSAPWLQKDPRMCITLPTWLKLIDGEPATVFTYRHPLEVALSLKKRDVSFTLEHGLRIWIVYNMRAIQNSAGLCRVLSSNEAILADPTKEVQRIADELRTRCKLAVPPREKLSKEIVDEFVNPSLQHNNKKRKAEEMNNKVLSDFGGGCLARDFDSDYPEGSSNHKSEVDMYLMAMYVYCDLKSGKAYDEDYTWPDLVNMKRPARIG